MNDFRTTRLACYNSSLIQAINLNLAPLFYVIFNKSFDLSLGKLGFITFYNFAVQLALDYISIYLVKSFGYKICIILANLCGFAGLSMLGILPMVMDVFGALIIATTFLGISAGIIEVCMTPIVDALPNDNNSKAIVLLHSFYSWGQTAVVLITTLALFWIGERYWFIIPVIWSIFPLLNSALFVKSPFPEFPEEIQEKSGNHLLKNSSFSIFIVIMICAGSTEIVISQWASYFAERGLGVSKVAGDLLGPCIFALMMGIGRTLYGLFGDRISIKKALCICSFLCIAAYAGISLLNSPILVMLCFALVGFGVSLAWPGTLAASAEHFSGAGTAMYAFLALSGDIGCSVGPWLVGIVNDLVITNKSLQFLSYLGFSLEQSALRTSILAATIFPIIMLAATVVLVRKSKKK